MEEWLSISEAARRLTATGDKIERSSLSRYVAQHAEALPQRQEGREKQVEFGALLQHRKENIRIVPQPVVQKRTQFVGTQADGAARKAQADAELREMDLAERRKILTRTAEVDRAGRDAIALMQSAFERTVETVAADVSLKYNWDERTARSVLKRFARLGLESFNQTILDRLDSMKPEPGELEVPEES
ncbi:hypothetical protein [uncultured Bartonella sp.]|uniref:hypothetical protein n=1 Tax=uncultured Bartonella sp. TaxID=104108 RepID=UPI00263514B6|nr:hypothetical protein [uncultured Bartonella sp.]